jgi:hypothetical protein
VDTGTHNLSDASQIEMVRFLNSVVGHPAPAADRPIEPPEELVLQVTPERDVHAAGSIPMSRLIARQAAALAASRRPLSLPALRTRLRRVLHVRIPARPPHHRRLFQTVVTRPESEQKVFRFVVETEPGIRCVLRHVCLSGEPYRLRPTPITRLYLPNVCSQQELESPQLLHAADDFWMLDVRGLGEALSALNDPLAWYGHEYMAAGHAILFGETLLGGRVGDVLQTVRLLRTEGARDIHLVGRGQGALLALLAGVLDEGIATVACREAPESIQSLVTTPLCNWPAVNFPRGVLRHFDLPDLRRALGRRLVEDTRAGGGSFAL